MKKKLLAALLIPAGLIVGGCITISATGSYTSNAKFEKAEQGQLQKKSVNYEGNYRNPVIIIHGFLGSKLKNAKTGENVWGHFTSEDVALPPGKMRALAIPMQQGAPLKDLKDDIVPDGMLDVVQITLMGMTFTVNAYKNLIDILHEGGYQPEGRPLDKGKNYYTLFQFAYDWRRDLQGNAEKLHNFILKKRSYLRKMYKALYGIDDYDVKFDIIGHSMGGLLSRYYLRYGDAELPEMDSKIKVPWTGAKYIDRLIILGTPNAGYLDTLLETVNGPEIPIFPTALLSTWMTYYQMLPEPSARSVVLEHDKDKAVDIYDINTWIKYKWGLASENQDDTLKILLPEIKTAEERHATAVDHLKKCLERAKRFRYAMRIRADHPESVKMYLILGNAVKTHCRATVNEKTGELKVLPENQGGVAPGDGKVLATSAMFDMREGKKIWVPFYYGPIKWNMIIQLRAAHMGITTDPAFKDNILFLLNSVPPKRYDKLIDNYFSEDFFE